MIPVLSSSKSWTSFPKEYVKQVTEALSQSFAEQAKIGFFLVDGRIYKNEILCQVGYIENDRLKQHNFQISGQIKEKSKKNKEAETLKLLSTIVDLGATLLEQLFDESDDSEFPSAWTPIHVEKTDFHIQYNTINTGLEKQASELLGEAPKPTSLVNESTPEEELENALESLGLEDLRDPSFKPSKGGK